MTIGIIVAIPPEFKVVKSLLKLENISENPYKTALTKIGNLTGVVVESGIGKVSAAGAAQYLIANYKPASIFNIGIGASIVKELDIGDVIVSNRFIQWDHNSGFFNKEKNWNPAYGKAILETLVPKNFEAGQIIIGTGDSFIDSKENKLELSNRGISFLDMEAGAIAQICHQNSTPFLTLKGVSDKGEGLDSNFKKTVRLATENSLNKLLEHLA